MSEAVRAVIERWFDAFATGDMAAARTLLRDDAVLHAGTPFREHRGFDAFIAWYESRREAAADFHYDVLDLMTSTTRVTALIALRADGVEWRQLALYEISEDQIANIWLFEEEPQSQPAPPTTVDGP